MIALENVTKRYGGMTVLDGVNLTVAPHEVVGVLGPSGAGKTTLLRIIAGLAAPDAGSAKVNAARIAYVFQEPRLLPWKSVLDNVRIPLEAMSPGTVESTDRATAWLARLGLGSRLDAYPGQLSGGMRQRVALARAFAVDPYLLLLDEPLGSLDPHLRLQLLDVIRGIIEDGGVTAVYVTHLPEELRRLATHVLVLDHGRILEAPRPEGPGSPRTGDDT